MVNRNFGIEIEFTGINRGMVSGILASFFSSEIEHISEKRTKIVDNLNRDWFITNDNSIKLSVSDETIVVSEVPLEELGTYRVELISPVLTYTDLNLLSSILERLVLAGAVVNETCGIHIHLDFVHDTPAIKRLILLMFNNGNMLYSALDIPKNRLRYCKRYANNLVKRITDSSVDSLDKLKDAWYEQYPNDKRDIKRNRTRYFGVNFHSAFRNKTVEFRLFNASFNIYIIKAYLDLCFALSDFSLSEKEIPVSSVTRFNIVDFSAWLRVLGISDIEASYLSAGLYKQYTPVESAI